MSNLHEVRSVSQRSPIRLGGESVRLADIFELLLGRETPVGFKAYDGSAAGPHDADAVVEIRSPTALSYIATRRPDLGLARAYAILCARAITRRILPDPPIPLLRCPLSQIRRHSSGPCPRLCASSESMRGSAT